MTINGSTKFVGIGTTTPDTKLQVVGSTTTSDLIVTDKTTSNSLDVTSNTTTNYLDVNRTTTTSDLNVYGRTTSSVIDVTGIISTPKFILNDDQNPPENGQFLTCDASGLASWVDVPESNPSPWLACGTSDIHFSEGNVGIGTTNTGDFKLAVNGKILAELIKVVGDVPASDYVFKEDYNLMSLYDLEKFVNKNQHLPEVKSAKEFKEEGYNIGDMDDVLLRKVEELTLYTIEQQKQLDKQQQVVDLLMKQLIELQEKINQNVN
jgi:hypothetical protein